MSLSVSTFVYLMLVALLDFQGLRGAQLQSSVDSSAVCPGERVTFTCTVDSSTHDWAITDGTTEQDIAVVTPANPSATDLGFELTVVDITAAPITSTATVNAATDLNGTVIVCRNELVPPNLIEQNTTVTIIGAPTAPSITMLSESSPTDNSITIRANLQPPVYGSECIQNYTVIARADGEEDVVVDSTMPGDVFVQVPVCPRRYTFTAHACSTVGCSGESAPITIDIPGGLLPLTSIEGDSGNLRWNPPQNAPPGCITSYAVTWDDGMFTTSDNRTSIPTDNIPGLDVCQPYTSITVTPIVPPFGPIQSSRGERLNMALIPSDFPSPSSLRVELFFYNASGIAIQLHWNVVLQNVDTAVDVHVGYSRNMDTCSRSVQVAQGVSGPNIPTTTARELLLNESVIGRETFFCVIFSLSVCERRSDTAASFCTPEDLGVIDATPDERCPGQQNSAQLTGGVACYTGVTPGSVAVYICNSTHHLEGSRFMIRECQSNGNWSGSAPQCVEVLSEVVMLGAGAVVGVSIAIFLLSFTSGALLAAVICGLRWRGKSSGQTHTSPTDGVQPTPVYDVVEEHPVDILEMKENVAYGPVGH